MKIPEEIILVARDVELSIGSESWTSSDPEIMVVGAVGSHGKWCPASKTFICDKILDPMYGWMNVFCWPTSYSTKLVYCRREDPQAVYGNSLEEVSLKLQLDGRKNVFEDFKEDLEDSRGTC